VNELLDTVPGANGGLGLWSDLAKITARVSIGGPIWAAKGRPDAFASLFRRNFDGTVNLNVPSITIDIEDVVFQRRPEQ